MKRSMAIIISILIVISSFPAASFAAGKANSPKESLTIGTKSLLGIKDKGNSKILNAYQCTLSKKATVKSLSIYVEDNSKGGKVRLGIFSDSKGKPGKLVAYTAEYTPAKLKAWSTKNVISPVTLMPGNYWLVFECDNDKFTTKCADLSKSNQSVQYKKWKYQKLPSSFPTGSGFSYDKSNCSFYVALIPVTTLTPTPSTTPTPEPTPAGGVYNVSAYGNLIEGDRSVVTEEQKQTNTKTIQAAINAAGKAGGGIVAIPAGTYCVTGRAGWECLRVDYDNITLQGAGMDKTKIETRSEFDASQASRAHGIVISGTADEKSPRNKVTLKDFELDGGAGWTGKYNWWGTNPDGWDTTHKGIALTGNGYFDNITFENINVHSYRGEVLYSGGFGLNRVTLTNVKVADTNASDFNLCASDLLVQNSEFGGPCRFWAELYCRTDVGNKEGLRFTNCNFHDAVGNYGIAFAYENRFFKEDQVYPVTFDHNSFSNAPIGVFLFANAQTGPFYINNNTFDNCGGQITDDPKYDKTFGAIMDFETNDNSKDIPISNVYFENNKVTNMNLGPFIDMRRTWCVPGVSSIKNLVIKDNYFEGKNASNPAEVASILYGAGTSWYAPFMEPPVPADTLGPVRLDGVQITGNIFVNCAVPKQVGAVLTNPGSRPLFANNSYVNAAYTDGAGTFNITSASPVITPAFEEAKVYTDKANLSAVLETTGGYVDGQYLKITGGSSGLPVKFAAGSSSYYVAADRNLTGTETLWFKFSSSQGKWIETTAPESTTH
jgi:hypothetical protein